MKKSTLFTAIVLGTSSLTFSASALATTEITTKPALIVDPVTGVVEGTTNVVSTVTKTTLGYTPKMNRYCEYEVTNLNTGMTKLVDGLGKTPLDMTSDVGSCNNPVFPDICNGTKYVITNLHTGKKYSVMGIRQGTMDVMHGDKMTRYQYVIPIVKPLK